MIAHATRQECLADRKGDNMGLLYASELREPSEWVRQNAQNILDSVIKAGGWKKVFPDKLPRWLHKLRNYFNVEPTSLRLMDKAVTERWMTEIRKHGHLNSFVGRRTLSGHVYFDEEIEVWYQMGPGGSIYHWGDPVRFPKIEAAHTHAFRGQTGIPIFKLISPDGTGGSRETIVSNPMVHRQKVDFGPNTPPMYIMVGRPHIGEVNQTVAVKARLITRIEHQGSYNFAETSVRGLDQHEKYDVETHKKDSVYIDPPDRFAPLSKRIFTDALLRKAGANTKSTKRDMNDISLDFDEPPMRRSPYGVSNPH